MQIQNHPFRIFRSGGSSDFSTLFRPNQLVRAKVLRLLGDDEALVQIEGRRIHLRCAPRWS